ncbi:MAG: Gfo/Idh/MocA family protein [Nitrospiraceae bacterium]
MKRIRTGVIGVGHLGQHHARQYATLPGSQLIGVVDSDPGRAKLIADRHAVRSYPQINSLLADVEAVSIAAPTSAHFSLAKSCLLAGKHLLVEKPVTVTPAEARELIELAKAHGCLLQVGHSERFNPIMQLMRQHIDRPAFIECHRLSSFGERGTDVDVVLDLMIHDLDLVLSFAPGPLEEVRAAGVPVLSRNIDIANARLVFGGGCVANLTSSRVSMTKMRRLRVFQRDRYVSMDFQTRQGMISRRLQQTGERPTIEVEHFRGTEEEPLKLEVESFLQAIATGSQPVVGGEAGLAVLELAYQVLDAIGHFLERHTAGGDERDAIGSTMLPN